MISAEIIAKANRSLEPALQAEFRELKKRLGKRGVDADAVVKRIMSFQVAVPSWGFSAGGTRFGRYPIPGEPRDIFEKIDDASAVNALTRATPGVSLHYPWDKTGEPERLKKHARARGLSFDAMNSNTFQDQPGQELSYKDGSLSHADKSVRAQAVRHNHEVVAFGKMIGSNSITVWIGDGADYPGQTSIADSFDRYIASLKKIRARLPRGFTMFIEYKPFEPAFYYTVLADWGSALMAATEVGENCKVLVDLGHHLPGTNIEAIVSRLIRAGKLGGFHLNDAHYADDDLTAGSANPYRLFRIFHELTLAEARIGRLFRPAYMIDQSHNQKDPIEALIQTAMEMQLTLARALIVRQEKLAVFQKANDVIMAENELKDAFNTDVRPLAAMARLWAGGAISPIDSYRASGYRDKKARERDGK